MFLFCKYAWVKPNSWRAALVVDGTEVTMTGLSSFSSRLVDTVKLPFQ